MSAAVDRSMISPHQSSQTRPNIFLQSEPQSGDEFFPEHRLYYRQFLALVFRQIPIHSRFESSVREECP